MPCNTITTTSINLGKVNHDLFLQTLIGLGLELQVSIRNGVTTIRLNTGETFNATSGLFTTTNTDAGARVAELKRAYSAQVVLSQARRMGWAVKKTATNKYEVVRR